ncbi:MAG: hypothetical protein ACRDOK_17215 [Streptosporangiaceae bacterium]
MRTPPSENVLIQAPAAGAAFASDPQLRQTVQQVVTALYRLPGAARDIRSPLDPGGRSLGLGRRPLGPSGSPAAAGCAPRPPPADYWAA